MPLPFIIGVVAGVGSGIGGVVKIKEAKEKQERAQRRHKRNIENYKNIEENTNKTLDNLGLLELTIQKSFGEFSDIIEKIHNRPEFVVYDKNGIKIPKIDRYKIKEASIGAELLLGSVVGLGMGALGGLAAGGVIFGITVHKLSEKAEEAYDQMLQAEQKITNVNNYLKDLENEAQKYIECLEKIYNIYKEYLYKLNEIVILNKKLNYNNFVREEKVILENTSSLVAILFKMCKLELIEKVEDKNYIPFIRKQEIENEIYDADKLLSNLNY